MKVGDKAFASEFVKALDKRQEKREKKRETRAGIGVVETYDAATNTASVFLYGDGYPSSGGFKSRSGVVPEVGDTVSYTIEGQQRWITGILHGDTPPKVAISPNAGWVKFTDDQTPSSPPPSGQVFLYWKNGVAYYMDSSGTESPAAEYDTVAPAVPQNPSLSSDTRAADDGTLVVYVEASWSAVADEDLEAYEVEIESAISPVEFSAYASGTGGTLPAGTYYVAVTGDGLSQGETLGVPETVVLTSGQRLYVNIDARTGITDYNIYAQRDSTPGLAMTTSTTGSDVEVTSEGTSGSPPTTGTALSFLTPVSLRTAATSVITEQVIGNTYYGMRVRARDFAGNASDWSSVATTTTTPDSDAPGVPSGVKAIGGYRLIGVRWDRIIVNDLKTYQVRWWSFNKPSNYTFTSDLSYWTVSDPTSSTWLASYDGRTGVLRTIGDGSGWEQVQQTVSVVPGKRYRHYADVQSNQVGHARTNLMWRDGSSNVIAQEDMTNTVTGAWETLTQFVTAPEGAETVTVEATVQNNSTATSYFDYVGFREETQFDTDSTAVVIQDVEPDIWYYVAVRAIDRSNNVRTSTGDGTAVDADENIDAGWSTVTYSPEGTDTMVKATNVGQADVAFDGIIANIISTGQLNADDIKTGTITVGGVSGVADYFVVVDSSNVQLLRIDENGLIAIDPDPVYDNGTYKYKAMRWWKGLLEFTNDYNSSNPNSSPWTTALSADGLVADVIKLGSAPGGYNMIPNSGFELVPFSVTASKTWTTTADFGGWISGTNINVTATGDVLQMTSYT